MPNPTELLPGTSIAATSWLIGGAPHLRVYTQDLDGNIRESRWDGSWLGGTNKEIIAKAKPYSALACFNFNDGKSIRVYYINADNMVQETCQDNFGNWYPGALNGAKIKVHPASRLTAIGVTWDIHQITLYHARPDGALGEIRYDNSNWVAGLPIGAKPIVGTGVAALRFKENSGGGIRCYYQLANGQLAEAGIDQGASWFAQGAFTSTSGPPATNFAAYSNGTPQLIRFQVYWLNQQNILTLKRFENGWLNEEHPANVTATPGSGVAVCSAFNADSMRVYVQDGATNQIQEYVREGATAAWTKGSIIPTGPTA